MKKIYLYGAGGYGRAVLDTFIENNCLNLISLVIDNNPGLKNATVYGKPIVSYKDICGLIDTNCTIIIGVELETALEISAQLKNDGIIRYMYWAQDQYTPFGEVIRVSQETDDYFIFSRSLLYELSTLKMQRDYLLSHCNPRNMKPATGTTRNRQLQLVDFAYEITSILNKEGIHPFMSSGNLLGYIRHDGFIPWDDDFDFAILRTEYIKMKDFLSSNYYYCKYDGPLNDDKKQLEWLKNELDKYPMRIMALERPMLFRVCKKTTDNEYLLVDFFPFDEFKSTASFQKRLEVLQTARKDLSIAKTTEEFDAVIKQIEEKDELFQESGGKLLGFGYDVRESYSSSRYNGFIKRENVFPLSLIKFEGKCFEVPNDPDAFLRYEFGNNYMELPSSIGLHFSPEDMKKL